MNFHEKIIEKLKEINSSSNDAFIEFFRFFNSEFDKLSPSEKESFLKMMERDMKLKDIINSIQ